MKKKIVFTIALLAAVLLVCGAFMPACGGGGGNSVTVLFRMNYQGAAEHPKNQTYKVGKTYRKLPAPTGTRPDYSFAGWFDVSAPTGGREITAETKVISEYEHVLYARWYGEELTVNFDLKGGRMRNGQTSLPDEKVRLGEFYGMAIPVGVPIRDDAEFWGWCVETDKGEVSVAETTVVTVASDHTIYAKWREYVSSLDFGDPDSLNFFQNGSLFSSAYFRSVKRGGDDKNWLEVSGGGAWFVVTRFNQEIKAGSAVSFVIDFNRRIEDCLGIWIFWKIDGWTDDALVLINQASGFPDTWDGPRAVTFDIPQTTNFFNIYVMYNQSKNGQKDFLPDLDSVCYYITDFKIAPPVVSKTSFNFDSESDLPYVTGAYSWTNPSGISGFKTEKREDGKNWLQINPTQNSVNWRFNYPVMPGSDISFWVDFGKVAAGSNFNFKVTRNGPNGTELYSSSNQAWDGPKQITLYTKEAAKFIQFSISYGGLMSTGLPVYTTGVQVTPPPPPKDSITFDDAVDLKYFILTDTVSALEERAGQSWMRLSGAETLQYVWLNMPVAAGSTVRFYVDFDDTAYSGAVIISGLGFGVQAAKEDWTWFVNQFNKEDIFTGPRLIEYTVAEDTETLTFIISYMRSWDESILIPANMLCFITDIQITRS